MSRPIALMLSIFLCLTPLLPVKAQDTVTGAFEGTVTNSDTGAPIAGATALIINQQTQQTYPKTSDSRGRFYQGLLPPGLYTIRVAAPGYLTKEVQQRLFITRTGEVVPVPVALDPAPGAPLSTPTPITPTTPPTGAPTPTPAAAPLTEADTDVRARLNAANASQGGAFTEEEVSRLPLGGRTVTRTFDELTLLLPGVAPPPQTLGSVAGPGVGAGVGSAGQFAVNGLRSRANNFTVDGSDNNDEDIGVRRQGFVALNSQPIESVKEYQAITLLAPAQFGRNIGAQVNAVSKSGGTATHGTLYGFFNASQLNARNAFDTALGNATAPLKTATGQPVTLTQLSAQGTVIFRERPITVRNQSGGEDSFTFGQAGFVLGGPLEPRRGPDRPPRMFYFISAEGYINNAVKEENFAVPTVEQRGIFNSGSSGVFRDPFTAAPTLAFPTTFGGDAIFSLYPFPNNPQGIYGPNTFTQVLPASAQGKVVSGKFDGHFRLGGRPQSLTNRYNFTDDWRIIPTTGGALFSSLQPRVRTQNNSFFLNSELSSPDARLGIFNQLRLSYGRTRLNFLEVRDPVFQLPSGLLNEPFLLNAPVLQNSTSPRFLIQNGQLVELGPNTGPVSYLSQLGRERETTEQVIGPIGQLNIAGFSPVGTDVFNFPQRRVNNTYQVADEITLRTGAHTYVLGIDLRRSELNSQLPRNARPLITFGGAPQLLLTTNSQGNLLGSFTNTFISPVTLAAASAASGLSQTFALKGESGINLRFYQHNFYAQDTWRLRPTLTLAYGLRYEYNTPPHETNRRIENTFADPAIGLIPGLRTFIEGRQQIFASDYNNFAPRLGLAYAPNLFGRDRITIVRAGYGIFYDQILGAVVSQSRNVYPSYLTADFAGGLSNERFLGNCPTFSQNGCGFELFNLSRAQIFGNPVVLPGTLNTINPALSLNQLVNFVNFFGNVGGQINASSFGFTIPQLHLEMPMAHHYSLTVEQQLSSNLVASVAYVGTLGRQLLRFATPNLGRNSFIAPLSMSGGGVLPGGFPFIAEPTFFGLTLPPGTRISPDSRALIGGRPVVGVGAVNRFETTATSRYDALQLQLRTRLRRHLQLQTAYTFAHATDDVSDVFDLAGASALPQDSFNLAAERAPANFDVRHRFAYNFILDLPSFSHQGTLARALLGGWQLASVGSFHTGQPFTVNSIFDVNLDGNLTDRLNTTQGLIRTGARRQPLRLSADPITLLAPIGQNGQVGRNSFRAGNILELNGALIKELRFGEQQAVSFRAEVFNLLNRANYGVPVRLLEAPGFGQATATVTPARRIQFALKLAL